LRDTSRWLRDVRLTRWENSSFNAFLVRSLFTYATDAWLVRGEAMEDMEKERRKTGHRQIPGPAGGS